MLKQGKTIKVVARVTGLALTGPQRAVGIRLVTGTLRNCALFDAPTIQHDEADRFVAKDAVASALADCAVLVPGAPIVFAPCTGGDGYPACNGSCSTGEQCLQTLDFRNTQFAGCSCYPAGVTPCGGSEFPACGGACSGGGATCQAFSFGRGGGCGCVDSQSTCPNGTGFPDVCPFQPGVCPGDGICTFIGNPPVACGCVFP